MFETEKGAVITEKNRGLDDPGRYLWEEVYKLAYTKHNYRYSTIGEVQSIRNFTVEDARSFYKNYYSPNNALIIVAGDVEPEAVMKSIVEKYGSFQPSLPQARDVTDEPRQLDERASIVTHPKATSRMLVKLWHVPNILHPDYPALATIGRLLASGKSAILHERILNKAKATEVFSDAYMSRDLGTFELFVQISAEETFEEIETIFSEAIVELANGKISGEQVSIVKNNLQREVYQAVTVPARLARLLGDSFIYTGDLSYQIKTIGEIEKVRTEDVQRVIKEYLLEGKSTTVKLLPEKEQ
jgi:zinc protease